MIISEGLLVSAERALPGLRAARVTRVSPVFHLWLSHMDLYRSLCGREMGAFGLDGNPVGRLLCEKCGLVLESREILVPVRSLEVE